MLVGALSRAGNVAIGLALARAMRRAGAVATSFTVASVVAPAPIASHVIAPPGIARIIAGILVVVAWIDVLLIVRLGPVRRAPI
jgi:hypothetical protein